MVDSAHATEAGPGMAKVRIVYMDRPWAWLAKGWSDMWKAPHISLFFGVVFAATGMLLTYISWEFRIYYYTFPLMAGFLLLGPILAGGLYEISRRVDSGDPITFSAVLTAWSRNGTQIALMGVVLLLINIAWVRLATIIFFGFFSDNPPGVEAIDFFNAILSTDAIPFLIVGNLVGAGMAAGTFAISAFSIPHLLDRNVNVIEAIAVSWAAVTRNVRTMALWAALIALFIGFGLLTGFLGLIIALPHIGHATWAAYKDVVE